MYGFAQVISWIRSICRVGTLYFIRDPRDPNYSAVKDMIERPTYSQLRKVRLLLSSDGSSLSASYVSRQDIEC